jgi:hypothetical protein
MVFGDKKTFAIECTPTASLDSTVYGHFLFWAANSVLGDPEQEALLRACVTYLAQSLQFQGKRHEPEFDNLTAEQLFAVLYDSMMYYPPPGTLPAEWLNDASAEEFRAPPYDWAARDRFHLDHVGMSSFADNIGIILVETFDGQQRLIWRNLNDWQVGEVILKRGQFEQTAHMFLDWIAEAHGIYP